MPYQLGPVDKSKSRPIWPGLDLRFCSLTTAILALWIFWPSIDGWMFSEGAVCKPPTCADPRDPFDSLAALLSGGALLGVAYTAYIQTRQTNALLQQQADAIFVQILTIFGDNLSRLSLPDGNDRTRMGDEAIFALLQELNREESMVGHDEMSARQPNVQTTDADLRRIRQSVWPDYFESYKQRFLPILEAMDLIIEWVATQPVQWRQLHFRLFNTKLTNGQRLFVQQFLIHPDRQLPSHKELQKRYQELERERAQK